MVAQRFGRSFLEDKLSVERENQIEIPRFKDNNLFNSYGVHEPRLDIRDYVITPKFEDNVALARTVSSLSSTRLSLTAASPTDDLYADQWHLGRIGNIEGIWAEYTGAGVTVAVYDNGIEYAHPDLDDNYDASQHITVDGITYDGNHVPEDGPEGTMIAGLIAAERNGVGTVGIAYDATLVSVNIFNPYSGGGLKSGIYVGGDLLTGNREAFYAAVSQSSNFDIANYSWNGETYYITRLEEGGKSFSDRVHEAITVAAATGRDGLGTIHVRISGNSTVDIQGEQLALDRHFINVGGFREVDGSAVFASSNGGALLVSAPSTDYDDIFDYRELGGSGLTTTDLVGRYGYNTTDDPGGYQNYTNLAVGNGTASPIVSGVIALMLDANEDLGWRDVHQILASSATLPVAFETGRTSFLVLGTQVRLNEGQFTVNGASNWNGGGRHWSPDYGYGAVDAHAAVRMSEVWSLFGPSQTSANEAFVRTPVYDVNFVIPTLAEDIFTEANWLAGFDGQPASFTFEVTENIDIEHLDFTMVYSYVPERQPGFESPEQGPLNGWKIRLTSPDGTQVFVDTKQPYYDDEVREGTNGQQNWTFSFENFRGDQALGTWKVEVEDPFSNNQSKVLSVQAEFTGTAPTDDTVYHYTDEFATMAAVAGEGDRQLLTDSSGNDWIDAAAVTSRVYLDLRSGTVRLGGVKAFDIAAGTTIEGVVSGDGADRLLGSAGNDILRGMRGDDQLSGRGGNDALHGGAGDDILSGGLGDDSLDGEGGDDRLTGGVGVDRLDGGDGDDILHGQGGIDELIGGAGDDVLLGGVGADRLSGGAGADIFAFGRFANTDTATDFAVAEDRIWLDGARFTKIESIDIDGDGTLDTRLSYGGGLLTLLGVNGLTLEAANALVVDGAMVAAKLAPVMMADELPVETPGSTTAVAVPAPAAAATPPSPVTGGLPATPPTPLTSDRFSLGFDNPLTDSDRAAVARWGNSSGSTPLSLGATSPTDDAYALQWHLGRLGGIEDVWKEYTGVGVNVGVYDSGVQYAHPDLDDNYDASQHITVNGITYDGDAVPLSGVHGTAVAGLIAAERNGFGAVGVAYDATLASVNIFDPYSGGKLNPGIYVNAPNLDLLFAALDQTANFDVVNHSWGGGTLYLPEAGRGEGTFANRAADALANAAETGRDGLGTVQVHAAGNHGYDNQGDGLSLDRHFINVAAYREIDSNAAFYSASGGALLVSAPSGDFEQLGGTGMFTTDLVGRYGYNMSNDPKGDHDYTDSFGGTSAAAPVVSGVVALVLDANEGLGWRDVHQILASSATMPVSFETGRTFWYSEEFDYSYPLNEGRFGINGADDWNGGGRHWSPDYGYGAIDAHAAVRMAEVWTLFDAPATSANEVLLSTPVYEINFEVVSPEQDIWDPNNVLADFDGKPASFTFEVTQDIEIEHLDFTMTYSFVPRRDPDSDTLGEQGGLNGWKIRLTSPDGSQVFVDTFQGYFNVFEGAPDDQAWTFGFENFRGDNAVGTWTVEIEDPFAGNIGRIETVQADFFGSPADDIDDVYHYTDEFLTMAALVGEEGRGLLTDLAGTDWINAAAVTSNIMLDLNPGKTSMFGDLESFRIAPNTLIENAVTGDGDDMLTGNSTANTLYGMRGNDRLLGMSGSDTLYGGAGADFLSGGNGADILIGGGGDDRLQGGFGSDRFVFGEGQGTDTILDFRRGDLIDLTAFSGVDRNDVVVSKGQIFIENGDLDTIILVKGDRVSDSALLFNLDAPASSLSSTSYADNWYAPSTGDAFRWYMPINEYAHLV